MRRRSVENLQATHALIGQGQSAGLLKSSQIPNTPNHLPNSEYITVNTKYTILNTVYQLPNTSKHAPSKALLSFQLPKWYLVYWYLIFSILDEILVIIVSFLAAQMVFGVLVFDI